MRRSDWEGVLRAITPEVLAYLASLPERRVYPDASPDEIRAVLGGPLPEDGAPAADVARRLARDLEPYVTAHASGRFFGFVIGGLHPAAWAAEVLTATWDQNAGLYAPTPGATIAEEVAAGWVVELLDLPVGSSVGFVTGGMMATFTCLAAGRDHVLREVGWDVEGDGLPGAPTVHVLTKEARHSTVPRALRYLGLGERRVVPVAGDDQDRVDPDALAAALAGLDGPTLVCVEAGNINTGSFDPFAAVADAADEHRARGNPTWVHVDGAIGLWARASAATAGLVEGLERLDSWSTDAHKLPGAAYDSGIAICRHPAPHRAAMSVRASYLVQGEGEVREPMDWNPEFSRRARGLGVHALLRSLGRRGVADLVERTCRLAGRFAERLSASGRAEVENDVVFNQVLVRWLPPDGVDADAFNDAVVARTVAEGTAYFSGTTWRGRRLMRISVTDWATDEDDVDRAVASLLSAAEATATRRS